MENENNIYTCPFCGQVYLDGKECNCDEAKLDRYFKNRIKKANECFDEILEDINNKYETKLTEQVEQIVRDVIEDVAYSRIYKFQIEVPGNIKLKVSINNSGTIKIERSVTDKDKKEITE